MCEEGYVSFFSGVSFGVAGEMLVCLESISLIPAHGAPFARPRYSIASGCNKSAGTPPRNRDWLQCLKYSYLYQHTYIYILGIRWGLSAPMADRPQ